MPEEISPELVERLMRVEANVARLEASEEAKDEIVAGMTELARRASLLGTIGKWTNQVAVYDPRDVDPHFP